MHDFKGFLCLALALCLIFALAVPCFADPVSLSGAEFFMSLWGAYASQHGLGMIFSTDGVQSSVQNPFSVQAYRDAGAQLVEDFLDYSNSIYSDAEEMYDAFKEEVTVTQDVNNQVIMHWSNTLTEWYDQFANWLLGEEYGLTATESGFTHSSGSFDSPLMSDNVLSIDGQPGTLAVNGLVLGSGQYQQRISTTNTTYPETFLWADSTYSYLYALSTSSHKLYLDSSQDYGVTWALAGNYANIQNLVNIDGVDYYFGNPKATYFGQPTLQLLNVISGISSSSVLSSASEVISLRPKDKYNEDPTANPIPIPDTSDAGYLPAPQDYVLNPSYVGSLPADIAALINSLTDALVENVDPLVAEANDPAPPSMTPVELPFLGFTLPSFNLGLSSIWHYVIDWVGSLGSGISFIGSVWNNIPYAMVIPIYATAVVVIVLGMFKRFLL